MDMADRIITRAAELVPYLSGNESMPIHAVIFQAEEEIGAKAHEMSIAFHRLRERIGDNLSVWSFHTDRATVASTMLAARVTT